jgi:hypothetical protein
VNTKLAGVEKTLCTIHATSTTPVKLEDNIHTLRNYLAEVKSLLDDTKSLRTQLQNFDVTHIDSLVIEEEVEMDGMQSLDGTVASVASVPSFNPGMRRKTRAASISMVPSFSKAFSTEFSELKAVQTSFDLIQTKTADIKKTIGNIIDINAKIDKLTEDVGDFGDENIEQQLSVQNQIKEELIQLESLLGELQKLKFQNAQKAEVGEKIQEECLKLFNQKIQEACKHYASQIDKHQRALSEAVEEVFRNLSSSYAEKQTKKDPIIQDYIKYINSIESIINALESAKHTLNAEGKRGAQSSTNPKNKKLAELNNEISKFKKKIIPRVGNK